MKSVPGKTLAEYALILALVVIVAIPAVILLGQVISDGLQQSGDLSQADDLFAIMDTDSGSSGSTAATIAVPTTPIGEDAGRLADPSEVLVNVGDDGSITFPNLDGSGGMVATSVNGTEMLLDIMDEVLTSGELPDGTKLPPDFDRQTLEALVNSGHAVADKERHLMSVENKSETKHLFERAEVFFTDYNEFKGYLDSYNGDPAVKAALEQYVGSYSGVIGNLTTQVGEHYNQQIGLSPSDPEYFNTAALPTGLPPVSTGSLDLNGVPVVTDYSAAKIQQVATP